MRNIDQLRTKYIEYMNVRIYILYIFILLAIYLFYQIYRLLGIYLSADLEKIVFVH